LVKLQSKMNLKFFCDKFKGEICSLMPKCQKFSFFFFENWPQNLHYWDPKVTHPSGHDQKPNTSCTCFRQFVRNFKACQKHTTLSTGRCNAVALGVKNSVWRNPNVIYSGAIIYCFSKLNFYFKRHWNCFCNNNFLFIAGK
jgi:hypothetical protein